MVPVDSSRVSRAPPYSGTRFESRSLSLTRLSRSLEPLSNGLQLETGLVTLLLLALQPPRYRNITGLGYVRFRSPLLSESRFLSTPGGTEMVHFPPFASSTLCIQVEIAWDHHAGFPHSEISGSTPVCGFPKLIAACHVLHRLFLPRHPPCALSSLTIEFTPAQRAYRHLKKSMFTSPGQHLCCHISKDTLMHDQLAASRLPK